VIYFNNEGNSDMAKINSDSASEQEIIAENQSAWWGTDEEISAFVKKYTVSQETALILNNEVFPWLDGVASSGI
jgi:hypothetical protein